MSHSKIPVTPENEVDKDTLSSRLDAVENVEAVHGNGVTPTAPATVTTTPNVIIMPAQRNELPGYNASTGQLTADKTGFYSFSIRVLVDKALDTNNILINPRVNSGSFDNIFDKSVTQSRSGLHAVAMVYLNAGDVFDLTVSMTGGTGSWVPGTNGFFIKYEGA
jgi:hypothetical protein